MKQSMLALFAVLLLFSFPVLSQTQDISVFKEEVKRIEQLTIKSIKLRQQINPEAEQEALNDEIKTLDSTLLKKVTLFLNE